jgi:hypothetical protein
MGMRAPFTEGGGFSILVGANYKDFQQQCVGRIWLVLAALLFLGAA